MIECPEAAGIDFEAYLVDPRAESFAAFRGHFPTCQHCSARLAALSRLEEAIRAGSQAEASTHPEAEDLLAYQSATPSQPDEPDELDELDQPARRSVELHLQRCGPCRDQLTALANFDLAPRRAAAPPLAEREPRLGDRLGLWHRLGGWLGDLAAPIPLTATAAVGALVLLVAVQAGFDMGPFGSDSNDTSPDAQRPIAEMPARATDSGQLADADARAVTPPPARELELDDADPAVDPPPANTPEPSLAEVQTPANPGREDGPARDPAQQANETRVAASNEAPAPLREAEPLSPLDALWAEARSEAPDDVRVAHARLGPPLYTPPANEVGPGRVHDVLRSGDPSIPDLWALAPDHAGRTLRASPTLYWSTSAATPGPLTFTLVDPAASQPVLEIELDRADGAGIGSISLADSDVQLVSGTVYQWFIALPEPDDDGFILVSGGSILRTDVSDAALSALADVAPADRGHHLAAGGYFYDAVDLFSRWDAHEARGALLSQTGLDLPAAPGI